MDNKIRQKMDEIKIPDNLHAKSRLGVAAAQSEIQARKKKGTKKGLFAAAGILVMIGGILFASFLNLENAAGEKQAEPVRSTQLLKFRQLKFRKKIRMGSSWR